MSRRKPNCDPWVQYSGLVNEIVSKEENGQIKWNQRNPDPVRARNPTFQRVGCEQSQDGAAMNKFRSPTGVIRPGVDPLPHHYEFEQNWKVIRPHVEDHERVFAKATRLRRQYDAKHEPVYMSIPEISRADADLKLRTEQSVTPLRAAEKGKTKSWGHNAQGEEEDHVRELMGSKERLLSGIAKVTSELDMLPPTGRRVATSSHAPLKCDADLSRSRLSTAVSRAASVASVFPSATDPKVRYITRAPFATPTRSRSTARGGGKTPPLVGHHEPPSTRGEPER